MVSAESIHGYCPSADDQAGWQAVETQLAGFQSLAAKKRRRSFKEPCTIFLVAAPIPTAWFQLDEPWGSRRGGVRVLATTSPVLAQSEAQKIRLLAPLWYFGQFFGNLVPVGEKEVENARCSFHTLHFCPSPAELASHVPVGEENLVHTVTRCSRYVSICSLGHCIASTNTTGPPNKTTVHICIAGVRPQNGCASTHAQCLWQRSDFRSHRLTKHFSSCPR